jgi:uncharacterized protein
MKAISFYGHEFVLHPCGLLIWPKENLAVVSDLHLEKASYYAQRGQFLPPYESFETLQKLSFDLEFCGIRKVIFLGDSFHDPSGFTRLDGQSKKLLEKLGEDYQLIWITGNHDKGFLPNGAVMAEELHIQNIVFRHEAIIGAQGEISGHFHPKARFIIKGQRLNHPCFITDDQKMILPAYGTLTGGMDITHPPFDQLFRGQYCAYILGKGRIYAVPSPAIKLK